MMTEEYEHRVSLISRFIHRKSSSVMSPSTPTTSQTPTPTTTMMITSYDSVSSPSIKPSPFSSLFHMLPREILCVISSFCDLHSNLQLSVCCRELSIASARNDVWMYILFSNVEINQNVHDILESYNRKAKKGRLTAIEAQVMQQSGSEFLKFLNVKLICQLNDLDFDSFIRGANGAMDGSHVPYMSTLSAITNSYQTSHHLNNHHHHHHQQQQLNHQIMIHDHQEVAHESENTDNEYMFGDYSSLQCRVREAFSDELSCINYKSQYVELMRNHKQAVEKRRIRRLEKSRRQNRLFTVASVSFLLLLVAMALYLTTQGLYLDGIIPQRRQFWLIPFMPLVLLLIPALSYMIGGFAIAIKWNPVVHQNYFTTLSKHTKNYFVLSLAHLTWIILVIILGGAKMIGQRGTPNWSRYMIPVYCCWMVNIVVNAILAFAVYREQKIEISHLLDVQNDSRGSQKMRKTGRALDCARAKISCSRFLCVALFFSYSCILVSTVLALQKYDAFLAKRKSYKTGYSVLLIPIYVTILFWIVCMPILLRHIVYILLGSPAPQRSMDFFQLARGMFIVITSLCAEILMFPLLVSAILFGLKLDNLIGIRYVWVFSPISFTYLIVFSTFGLLCLYVLYSLMKNKY